MSTPADLGIVESLRPGEYQRAEELFDSLSALGIRHLRSHLAWSDWQRPGGKTWFDWLIPRAAEYFELLPCFSCTPPPPERTRADEDPPCEPRAFADFVEAMIHEYGNAFHWVELGNSLDDRRAWDWRLDSNWKHFSRMVGKASHRARQHGKKPVLAGIAARDLEWLDLLCAGGLLQHVAALGISGFPGTWDFDWPGWQRVIADIQAVLDRHELTPELWITAAGYSTWRHDETEQLRQLRGAVAAPVPRVYWYSFFDRPPQRPCPHYLREDERCYHFGLKRCDGQSKLSHRIWHQRGLRGAAQFADRLLHCNDQRGGAAGAKVSLITGGAGFIGSNLAHRLIRQGRRVMLLDNLQRPGVEHNLETLLESGNDHLEVLAADVRDPLAVREALARADEIYHLAAQVAVTTSLEAPREDFHTNLEGTLNILEQLRRFDEPPPLIFTSTNKVYGALNQVPVIPVAGRYRPTAALQEGVSESHGLDFQSPYGCSKGAADQYVLDYARSYGIPAMVFRMSCIYGPRQLGTEDQGWVAHFMSRALRGETITLYGDGRQVRDLLFVDDLVDALLLARRHAPQLSGRAYNMGGGPDHSVSLLELLARIESLVGYRCRYRFADWRPGDQRYYVSDTRLFRSLCDWQPRTPLETGLARLQRWLESQLREPGTTQAAAAPVSKTPHTEGREALHGRPG